MVSWVSTRGTVGEPGGAPTPRSPPCNPARLRAPSPRMPQAAFTADLDDAVAKHLRTTFISLMESATVVDSLAHLRGSQLPEQVVYFYVVDADRRLVGV